METRQMSLFESTFDRFLIDRPIRLIELFAGIGAQKNILEAIPIPTANSKGFELATEGDGVLPTWKGARGTVQKQSCPTIMTDGNTIGVVVRKESKDDE